MKKSRYAQAFESMSPSEEQKNKIYNNIIEKQKKKERNKKQLPNIFFRTVPTIAAAATATAFISAFIIIAIQSDTISGGIGKLFENVGHDHPEVKTQLSKDSGNAIGDLSIYDVYYSDDKMAVIYEFITDDEVLGNCRTLNADITSKINGSIISSDENSAVFVKSDDKFLSEAVYDIENISETENVFTLQSEIKNIYGTGSKTDTTFTTGKFKGKCIASVQTEKNANDAVNEYYPKTRTNMGSLEKITITPFETVIDMTGDCDISLYDQNGMMLKNLHDNLFEPLPMNTEQLNIVVSDEPSDMLISVSFKNPEGFRVPYNTSDDSGIFIKLATNYDNDLSEPNTDTPGIISVYETYIPHSEISNENDAISADNFISEENFTIKVQSSFIEKDKALGSKLYVNCIIKNNSAKICAANLEDFFVIDADISPYYLDSQKHYAEYNEQTFVYDEEILRFEANEEKTVTMEYRILSDNTDGRFYLVTEFRNDNENVDIIRLEPAIIQK